MRDRLIELISGIVSCAEDERTFSEIIADHLLANGVIVPPCKVGQTVNDITTPKHPSYNCQRGMLCPACDKALWTRVEIKGLFCTKKVTIKEQPNFCKFCGQALLSAYTEH